MFSYKKVFSIQYFRQIKQFKLPNFSRTKDEILEKFLPNESYVKREKKRGETIRDMSRTDTKKRREYLR